MKLAVDGVHFRYNSHPVLAGVSFSLGRGQILCVLGVNGAGKSTLLKCLNRVLAPQRGSVLVDGQDLSRLNRRQVARNMGYVSQRQPESGWTVFETVLMGRRPHLGWSPSAEDYGQVEGVIRQLGIAHLAMRSLHDLSGGEAQKVIIARALAQAPEVLLLDEPTSSLDLKNQLEVMGLVRRVVEARELAAVVAIHDLNIAVRIADVLLFLKDGRIHGVSTPEALTPETIRQVYDVEVTLVPVGGRKVVAPL